MVNWKFGWTSLPWGNTCNPEASYPTPRSCQPWTAVTHRKVTRRLQDGAGFPRLEETYSSPHRTKILSWGPDYPRKVSVSPPPPPTPTSPFPAPWAQYLIIPALQLDTFSLKGSWRCFAILRLLVFWRTKLQGLLEFPTVEGGALTRGRETKLGPFGAVAATDLLVSGDLTQCLRNFLFLQACRLLEVAVYIPGGRFPQPTLAT